MLLTRLFNHIISNFPELSNDQYVLYDRVIHPRAPHYERKTQKDYGTKRGRPSTSASSYSAFDHPSSSHHVDEDNNKNDEGDYLSEAWTHFMDLLKKFPHHGIDLSLQVQIFYDRVNPATRQTIDQAAGGFMASQDARLSKFEVDFKQQQGEMTNKIDIVLKAINNRITGALQWLTNLFDLVTLISKIMRKQLEPREDPEGIRGISNFTGRIKGMHIFKGNFTYVLDFMIVEDIRSFMDPRLSQEVLEKPFIKLSDTTHDLSLGVVKFTDGANEVAYKMRHKI
nr:MAK10-like protein [Tanacetum cinerariifolium]